MKPASPALQTLLATDQFYMADLYTFTLVGGGAPLRYADADVDIKVGAEAFTSSGPRFVRQSRNRAHWKIGLEVDTLDIEVAPQPTDLVNGIPFLAALHAGLLDGAEVQLDRAFMAAWGDTSAGTVVLFVGRVGNVEAGRTSAVIHVNSHLELLDIQMPRNLYQPSCVNTLFDSSCTLQRAPFAIGGTTVPGATQSAIFAMLAQPSGWFDLGTLRMTSGGNAGLSRMVKTYVQGAPGTLNLVSPFPLALSGGEQFIAYPGCDKTLAACQAKFNNLLHFKGFPYIPAPETAI